MEKLYCLTFYTNPNGNYREGFHIGLFASYEEAEAVKVRYLNEVNGFKDYDCEAEITEVPVIGNDANIQNVYRFMGWNENEYDDEIDIIESDCYTSRTQAETEFKIAQQEITRQEWALNCHTIGKCDWKEGFTRYTYCE